MLIRLKLMSDSSDTEKIKWWFSSSRSALYIYRQMRVRTFQDYVYICTYRGHAYSANLRNYSLTLHFSVEILLTVTHFPNQPKYLHISSFLTCIYSMFLAHRMHFSTFCYMFHLHEMGITAWHLDSIAQGKLTLAYS